MSRDGNEVTSQVDYTAPFLLDNALSPESRVVDVSSSLYRGGYVNGNDLNRRRRYHRNAVWAQSKLALPMFARALTEFGSSGRTPTSLHPGVIYTGMLPAYSFCGRPAGEGPRFR